MHTVPVATLHTSECCRCHKNVSDCLHVCPPHQPDIAELTVLFLSVLFSHFFFKELYLLLSVILLHYIHGTWIGPCPIYAWLLSCACARNGCVFWGRPEVANSIPIDEQEELKLAVIWSDQRYSWGWAGYCSLYCCHTFWHRAKYHQQDILTAAVCMHCTIVIIFYSTRRYEFRIAAAWSFQNELWSEAISWLYKEKDQKPTFPWAHLYKDVFTPPARICHGISTCLIYMTNTLLLHYSLFNTLGISSSSRLCTLFSHIRVWYIYRKIVCKKKRIAWDGFPFGTLVKVWPFLGCWNEGSTVELCQAMLWCDRCN